MKLRGSATLFLTLLFLISFSAAVAPQAEVPTWNVGDSWGMGITDYDLTPILNSIFQNLTSFSPDVSTGDLDYYMLYKVTGETSNQYTLSISQGVGVNAAIEVSDTFNGQTLSVRLDMNGSLIIDGTLDVNKSDLSISGGTISLKLDVKLNANGLPEKLAAMRNPKVSVSGTLTVQCDPPIDLFDFPISVGEQWEISTTATISGSLSGEATIPRKGTESMDVSMDAPVNKTTEISMTATCTGTAQIQTPDGNTVTVYEIQLSGSGAGLYILGCTLYYSPDEKFIISQKIDMAGLLSEEVVGSEFSSYTSLFSSLPEGSTLITTEPMTESEVSKGIESIRASGFNLAPLLVIGVIVAGAAVTAVVILKRR